MKDLIKLADDLFSQYIRLRDSNAAGYGNCISCTTNVFWKYATCGHFVKRRYLILRWDKKNAFLQCPMCNVADSEEMMRLGIVQRYGEEGEEMINYCLARKNSLEKTTKSDIGTIIADLRIEIAKLKIHKK